MIEIVVIGVEPKGQPRARAFACRTKGGGVRARMYAKDSDGVANYREALWHAAQKVKPEKPIDGPVRIDCVYSMQRPRSHMNRKCELKAPHYPMEFCTKRPDIDNLDKLVMDTLTACGYWIDDSQITDLHSCKRWAHPTHEPGVSIQIAPWLCGKVVQ